MIDYEEDWIVQVIFRAECKVATRALYFAVPATIFAVLLNLGLVHLEDTVEDAGLPSITDDQFTKKPSTWLALSAFIVLLLEFRTRQALSRFWEGTSLLHQMRGEWFDSISCLVTFSLPAAGAKPQEVQAFRNTIVRLMSLCHGSALEEIADSDQVISRLDCDGIDEITKANIVYCKETYGFNRVEMVLKIIYTCMTKALDDGVLKIPPPILTRVYQTLSRGFVCILNAKKITDTRFPFPYAQLIAGLLLIMEFAIPCLMAMLIRNPVWAALFTFVPLFGLFSLNFIASELENPFGHDDNDLPLEHFQAEMNSSLLMLLHGNADHVAGLSDEAEMDFHRLARGLNFGTKSPRETLRFQRQSSRLSRFETMCFSDEDLSEEHTGEEACSGLEKTIPETDDKTEGEMALRRLAKSMLEFNRTLQKWTRTVECQVGELRRTYDAIKKVVGSTTSSV